MKKLAIITTHPIQYYAPVFQNLAQYCLVKVFYTWGKAGMGDKFDPAFGRTIKWDIPLLEGYDYEFLKNEAKDPGSHHFYGIRNKDIIERIYEFKPDAILVYGWSYASHLKVLSHFYKKVPVWFRGDSTLLNNCGRMKPWIKKKGLKWIYSHVDIAFNVGKANKAYFKEYGLQEKQIKWAPHSIDNERFAKKSSLEALLLREKLGISPDAIVILFAGKLQEQKNPQLLLNAFAELVFADTHLLFVGNGVLEDSLKATVKVLGIESRVSFLGFQNQQQMPLIYQVGDVFCLPSKSETWGLSVNEAMASGRAVLVSDKVGCAQDLVHNGVNGFVFESNRSEDLTNKLYQILNSDLKEMGKKSSLIISDYHLSKQVDVFLTQLNLLAIDE